MRTPKAQAQDWLFPHVRNPIVSSAAEFTRKASSDHPFVRSVVKDRKIPLIGDADELGRLAFTIRTTREEKEKRRFRGWGKRCFHTQGPPRGNPACIRGVLRRLTWPERERDRPQPERDFLDASRRESSSRSRMVFKGTRAPSMGRLPRGSAHDPPPESLAGDIACREILPPTTSRKPAISPLEPPLSSCGGIPGTPRDDPRSSGPYRSSQCRAVIRTSCTGGLQMGQGRRISAASDSIMGIRPLSKREHPSL
jgi:hypothetical protein